MDESQPYDVAIVGASIGGSAAAILFARRGLRVVLLERQPDPAAYKRICTHYIQGSATPTLRRLGVVEAVEAAGGRPNGADVWTRWGWVRPTRPDPAHNPTHGYNIPRAKLDPLLRDRAVKAGAELRLGTRVRGLVRTSRVEGVRVVTHDGTQQVLRARLVVGADGRDSSLAKLAGVPARSRPNDRFACFAWYRGLTLTSQGDSQFWCLEPDWGYAYPYAGGLTLMCAFVTRDKLPEWTEDPEGCFERFLEHLPEGPKIKDGERVGEVHRMLHMPNTSRPAAADGVAFVGDAALAADPLVGVGCGFALQAAEWLVDCTADALAGRGSLARALRRYRRRHRRELSAHAYFISLSSLARPLNPLEKLVFRAGAHDGVMADHLHEFLKRNTGVVQFVSPARLARALWVAWRHRRARTA